MRFYKFCIIFDRFLPILPHTYRVNKVKHKRNKTQIKQCANKKAEAFTRQSSKPLGNLLRFYMVLFFLSCNGSVVALSVLQFGYGVFLRLESIIRSEFFDMLLYHFMTRQTFGLFHVLFLIFEIICVIL